MQFDTTLSLDIVISILAILAAVWRLESKLDKRISDLRQELKGDHTNLRNELKSDNADRRNEVKAENAELRRDIRRVEDKVDNANQRLARLEGIILAREDMVESIAETPQ